MDIGNSKNYLGINLGVNSNIFSFSLSKTSSLNHIIQNICCWTLKTTSLVLATCFWSFWWNLDNLSWHLWMGLQTRCHLFLDSDEIWRQLADTCGYWIYKYGAGQVDLFLAKRLHSHYSAVYYFLLMYRSVHLEHHSGWSYEILFIGSQYPKISFTVVHR